MLNLLTGRSSRTEKADTRQAAANLPDNNVWLMLSRSARKHLKGEILKLLLCLSGFNEDLPSVVVENFVLFDFLICHMCKIN